MQAFFCEIKICLGQKGRHFSRRALIVIVLNLELLRIFKIFLILVCRLVDIRHKFELLLYTAELNPAMDRSVCEN